jgi:hypothetical protein
VAPSKAGKYHAFFRLMHKENIEFGEKVFVDLEVIDKPSEVGPIAIEEAVIVPQAEPVVNFENKEATEEKSASVQLLMRSEALLNKFENDEEDLDKSFEVNTDAKSENTDKVEIVEMDKTGEEAKIESTVTQQNTDNLSKVSAMDASVYT